MTAVALRPDHHRRLGRTVGGGLQSTPARSRSPTARSAATPPARRRRLDGTARRRSPTARSAATPPATTAAACTAMTTARRRSPTARSAATPPAIRRRRVQRYGTATLTDCTISGNSARNGGGVHYLERHGDAHRTARSAATPPHGGGGLLSVGRPDDDRRHDRRGQHRRRLPNAIGGGTTDVRAVQPDRHRRLGRLHRGRPATSPPARSIRGWPRWATTAGRPRPWPSSPAAPPSARARGRRRHHHRPARLRRSTRPSPTSALPDPARLVVNTTIDGTGSPLGRPEPPPGRQPGRRYRRAPRRSPSTRPSSPRRRRSP